MVKKIFLSVLLLSVVLFSLADVHAGLLDTIIGQGNTFGTNATGGNYASFSSNLATFVTTDVKGAVAAVGYLIFAAVTVILGAKYIWSSAEGKSEVMESLPGFVVAVIFFYLADNLVAVLGGNTGLATGSWDSLSQKIIGTINIIVRYTAFGGILFIGLKYMFASAEGKSQLKTSMGGMIIGMVFVFLASGVVEFIINIGSTVVQ